MRVRTKFIAITAFVATVPLVMSAAQSIRVHERALDDTLLQLHATSANLGAFAVEQRILGVRSALSSTVKQTIDWESLEPSERLAALQLVLAQIPQATVASIAGENQRASYVVQESDAGSALSTADLVEFGKVLPPGAHEVTLGAPLLTSTGRLILPMTATDRSPEGDMTTVGLGLDLGQLCVDLVRAQPKEGSVQLVDAWHRSVCTNGRAGTLTPVDAVLRTAIETSQPFYSRSTGNGEMKGALAATPLGFSVLAEQPLSLLSAPSSTLRQQVALWLIVGLLAALASGWVLGRSILSPLGDLTRAAQRIGAGMFGERLSATHLDAEFATVAHSFNTMSEAIATRDNEIQTWNRELQNRVDERSRELEAAQDALLASRKMAGLSVTTAGVAHELNNPLTGVLGLAQVLRARLLRRNEQPQEAEILTSIVHESKRMQALLERMKVLHSEDENSNFRPVHAGNLLDSVLLTRREVLDPTKTLVQRRYPHSPTFVSGNLERLHMVFAELVENALQSIFDAHPADGGILTLEIRQTSNDWVELSVQDNGKGIPATDVDRVFEPFFTTKPNGKGQGLGLAQVYRMVESHGGKVWVDRKFNPGCRLVVRLPHTTVGTHLV
jgi:two-component system, NtrC family, sensor kinase